MPFTPGILYTGFRAAQYSPSGKLDHAYANVIVSFRTPIDYKLRVEIPVPVKGTEVLDPKYFIHAGDAYPLTKEALASLMFGTASTAKRVSNIFNDPKIVSYNAFANGIYSTDAISGRRLENYPGSINAGI